MLTERRFTGVQCLKHRSLIHKIKKCMLNLGRLGLFLLIILTLSACHSSKHLQHTKNPYSIYPGEPVPTQIKDFLDYSADIRGESQLIRTDGKHYGMRSDVNKDGLLDFEEFRHHKHAIYMKWDKNQDGLFTRTEFRVRGINEPSVVDATRINKKFDMNDKNQDGHLDLQEFGEVWRHSFRQIDKNKDGYIDTKEMAEKQEIK